MQASTLHRITRMLWIPLLAFVAGVPIIAWALTVSWKDNLSSDFLFLTTLGQFSGILGMQLFAFTLILSSRLTFLEFFFGGLDRMYVIHHRTGVIAFALLALHPLVLAFRFLGDSVEEVMNFLTPTFGSSTFPKDIGILAILLMLVLIGLTFYGSFFSYPKLKVAHKFLGAAFFLGGLHMYLIPGVITDNFFVKVFCVTTALVGVVLFTYRSLLARYVVMKYSYTVDTTKDIGSGCVEITLRPAKKKVLTHLPGQFAMLSFINAKSVSDEEHPFTISSASLDGSLRFSVKALGDYTTELQKLGIGVKAKVEGPFGEFSYLYGDKEQIWVAGGIGVTPFVSMAEHLLRQEKMEYVVDFFYSVRSETDGVYKAMFDQLAAKHDQFKFHFMPSDKAGYVTGEGILKTVKDGDSRDYFVCGPPPMMLALREQLIALNVNEDKIHSERFALLK